MWKQIVVCGLLVIVSKYTIQFRLSACVYSITFYECSALNAIIATITSATIIVSNARNENIYTSEQSCKQAPCRGKFVLRDTLFTTVLLIKPVGFELYNKAAAARAVE